VIAFLRRWPSEVRYSLALVLVVLLAAAFATAFRLALSGVFRTFFGEPDVIAAFRSIPAAARVALPASGGLLAGLLG